MQVTIENDNLQVVTFVLGQEEFAVDVHRVQEIIRMSEITWVPKCPRYIKGVINLRGNLIPVANLRECLGMPNVDYQKKTRIIIMELEEVVVGLIVDSVMESKSIAVDCLTPPPTIVMGGIESEYIIGVAKLDDRLLVLLDIEKIISVNHQRD